MSAYSSRILARGTTQVYLRLGETSGTAPQDATANNRDGVHVGGVTVGVTGLSPGDSDKAAQYNGSTGYTTIADNAAFSADTTGGLTIEVAANIPALDDHTICSKAGAGSQYEWGITAHASAGLVNLRFQVWTAAGGGIADFFANGITPGVHHIAMVINVTGSSLIGYVDGIEVGRDDTWSGTYVNGTAPVTIGRRGDAVSYFQGVIDEFSIDSTVLSAAAILADAQAFFEVATALPARASYHWGSRAAGASGTGSLSAFDSAVLALPSLEGYWQADETAGTVGQDSTANNRDMTLNGGVALNTTPGFIVGDSDGAWDFDGVDDYAALPDNAAWSAPTTGELSVGGWFELTGQDGACLIAKGGTGGAYEWGLIQWQGGGGLVGVVGSLWGNAGAGVADAWANGLTPGRHFIVLTIHAFGEHAVIYVDGVEAGRDDTWLNTANFLDTTAPVNVGRRGTDGMYWSGRAGKIFICNAVLGAPAILNLYNVATASTGVATPGRPTFHWAPRTAGASGTGTTGEVLTAADDAQLIYNPTVTGTALINTLPAFLLEDHHVYAWQVVGYDTDGLPTSSLIQSFVTAFAPPEALFGLAATADPDGRGVVLTWFPSADPYLHHYRVYRRDSSGAFVRIDGGPASLLDGRTPLIATTFTDYGADLGTTEYSVTAHNGALEGDPSSVTGTLRLATPGPLWMFVTADGDPRYALRFEVTGAPRTWGIDLETFAPPGRGFPVHLNWGSSGRQVSLSLRYLPAEDGDIKARLAEIMVSGLEGFIKAAEGYLWDTMRVRVVGLTDTVEEWGWVGCSLDLAEIAIH